MDVDLDLILNSGSLTYFLSLMLNFTFFKKNSFSFEVGLHINYKLFIIYKLIIHAIN